jgi:hypothetical protein
MKKILFILSMIIIVKTNAQNTYPWPSNANIGIGSNLSIGASATTNNYGGPGQYGAIEFPRGEIMFSNTNTQNQFYLFHNAYTNASGTQSYRNSAAASSFGQDSGTMFFFTAPSGTAGSAITWTPRMLISNGGNVGIGTGTPTAKLEVASTGTGGSILMYGGVIGTKNDGHELNLVGSIPLDGAWSTQHGGHIRLGGSARGDSEKNAIQFIQNGVEKMRVHDGGNVGIGTTTPAAKLDVANSATLGTGLGNALLLTRLSNYSSSTNYFMNNLWAYRYTAGGSWLTTALHDGISIDVSFVTPGTDTRTWWERRPFENIQKWGNANETYMTLIGAYPAGGVVTTLAIQGVVHSKEVKVDLNVEGPDYVFEKEYSLPSLESVKTYIDQNKHLPEVPSAKEMEANGINVSEMNMLLLRKIEELTLYVIDQRKEIDELKNRSVSPRVSGEKVEELMLYVIDLKEKNDELNKKYEEIMKRIK